MITVKEMSPVEILAAEPDLGTHQDVQEKYADEEANAKKPKAKKPKAKTTKPKAAKKAHKKTSKPKAKKPAKAKRALKKPAPGRRGVRKDGKPRRKAGTNKPKSPEAAAFGKRMAKARHAKEWTQAELAKRLGMGQPSIANIERGVIPAAPETQTRIKKVLGF